MGLGAEWRKRASLLTGTGMVWAALCIHSSHWGCSESSSLSGSTRTTARAELGSPYHCSLCLQCHLLLFLTANSKNIPSDSTSTAIDSGSLPNYPPPSCHGNTFISYLSLHIVSSLRVGMRSLYPAVCLFICLSICLSTHPSIHLSIHPSKSPTGLSTGLCITLDK